MRAAMPACVLAVLLAACGRPPQAPTGPVDLAGGSSIEWQGVLACADCDGIDTRLVLQRSGASRDYLLSETYLDGGDGARFLEHGRWQREQTLLRLSGDGGAKRVYALLPDGRLEPRDGHGRPFPEREDDFLLPVTVSDGP